MLRAAPGKASLRRDGQVYCSQSPRLEEARKLPSGSALELYRQTFLPLLENGPKRTDQLGYSPTVASRALHLLWQHGLVKRKTVTRRTAVGAVASVYWWPASRPPPTFGAELEREGSMASCTAAIEDLLNPCAAVSA